MPPMQSVRPTRMRRSVRCRTCDPRLNPGTQHIVLSAGIECQQQSTSCARTAEDQWSPPERNFLEAASEHDAPAVWRLPRSWWSFSASSWWSPSASSWWCSSAKLRVFGNSAARAWGGEIPDRFGRVLSAVSFLSRFVLEPCPARCLSWAVSNSAVRGVWARSAGSVRQPDARAASENSLLSTSSQPALAALDE